MVKTTGLPAILLGWFISHQDNYILRTSLAVVPKAQDQPNRDILRANPTAANGEQNL